MNIVFENNAAGRPRAGKTVVEGDLVGASAAPARTDLPSCLKIAKLSGCLYLSILLHQSPNRQ